MDWKKAIFSNALCCEVRTQYRKLLSAGLSEEQVETVLVSELLHNESADMPTLRLFWIALGLTEWELGRLSTRVYEKAMAYLDNPPEPISEQTNRAIKGILTSPLPAKKKIPLARVRKCPWPKGSLLAYRIITNEQCESSRYWSHFVLLRVVSIIKHPVSYLAPTARSSESMVVALYPWVGHEIPPSDVVDGMTITPFCIRKAVLPQDIIEKQIINAGFSGRIPEEFIRKLSSSRCIYYFMLDWESTRKALGKIVYLDCAPDFKVPQSVELTDITDVELAGYHAFDIVLVKRLEDLFN